ncbi:MAG: hypothetical protein ACKVH7_16660, partial [Alphaproteobacteria bacterium]
FKLCAGRGSVLATTPLSQDSKNLVLELGPDAMIASPEKVARYAASLGRAMACKVTVVDTANA